MEKNCISKSKKKEKILGTNVTERLKFEKKNKNSIIKWAKAITDSAHLTYIKNDPTHEKILNYTRNKINVN